MRDGKRLGDSGAVRQLYLNLGDVLKHELEGVLVLELIVDIDLVLQNLASVVAKEGPDELAVHLDFLFSLREVMRDLIEVALTRHMLPQRDQHLCFLFWAHASAPDKPCAPREAAEAQERSLNLSRLSPRLTTADAL